MAIITGQVARGENYWDRPYLMEDVKDIIESGGDILLVAPRRVGKTSLMYRILDTMNEEYIVIYVDTEAKQSVDGFWEKLFSELMDDEFVATLKNRSTALWNKIRSIRQNEKVSSKVIFIYAGSIGLESVVGHINASKYINDLTNITIPPLDKDDAKRFTIHLCYSNGIEIAESEVEYLLDKIQWCIPFYIQLIVQEIKRLYRREPKVDLKVIDRAVEKVLESRKDFAHWVERLKTLPSQENRYAKELLTLISKDGSAQTSQLQNLATKHQLNESEAKSVINALVYDGYINNSENPRIYRFNSPLLQIWWYRNVAS